MIATLMMFLALSRPAVELTTTKPAQPWALELTIEAWDQRITLRLPAATDLECEELRDTWLVDGPRDREGFRSSVECVLRGSEREST